MSIKIMGAGQQIILKIMKNINFSHHRLVYKGRQCFNYANTLENETIIGH